MTDIESELMALFDAHKRVVQTKIVQLEEHKDPDERGAVIDSFEIAAAEIRNTAIDKVGNEIDRRVEIEKKLIREEE